MTTYDEATQAAWLAQSKWLGADAALAAATWLTLSVEQARSVLDDIDPAVLDDINEPNLSGEFADELTPDLLADEVGLTRDELTICPEGDELVEAIATAWEEGRDLVWSNAVQAYALRLLGDIPAALRVEQANEATVTELRLHSEHLEAADRVARLATQDNDDGYDWTEGPTCSICDGVGHGYPGAGPCPLESPDPGYYADELAAGR